MATNEALNQTVVTGIFTTVYFIYRSWRLTKQVSLELKDLNPLIDAVKVQSDQIKRLTELLCKTNEAHMDLIEQSRKWLKTRSLF